MIENFLVFLGLIIVMAALFRQDFVFSILYLMAGAYLVGSWWSRRAMAAVTCRREFSRRAFLDEQVPVRLQIKNSGWLPVVWLRVYDALPVELSARKIFKEVVSLEPYGEISTEYILNARKRGFYKIGPLLTASGDLLGLGREHHLQGAADSLTVYPKIIPLTRITLPSSSPMGTLRHNQPIYEDPSRVFGKRDYVAGDSLRRVDWKSSAATGKMQVKQFEPSIALETSIFLNLNLSEYEQRTRLDATELGIVVAASIAAWVAGQKQPVGLATNGLDPLGVPTNGETAAPNSRQSLPRIQTVPPRKGQGHLMRLLDQLARVQAAPTISVVELLQKEYLNLHWGATLVLITGQVDEALYDMLFQVRRRGLHLVLILCGPIHNLNEVRHRAETFKFPVYFFQSEHDLDIWRR